MAELHRLMVLALALLLGAAPPTFAQNASLLGSPDFKPTPERPIGWRGDGTGRYVGATPPVEWSRRVKGITTELKIQADKPVGEPGAAAHVLEYFTVKDWLVAGPFSVGDPVTDFAKDLLGGEATVQPAKDAPAGTATWKPLHIGVDTQSRHDCNDGTCGNSNIDFVYLYGKITGWPKPKAEGDLENKVAYAHTNIYSPADAQVELQLPFNGKAGRFWLNGKSTDLDPKSRNKTFDVSLAKGWNRLLIKVSTDNGVGKNGDHGWESRWLAAAYLIPRGPVDYQTKNIAWMTRMTGRSMSQPIIVGDRIYVGSGITDLLCIDKKTGKVLWMHSNTPYDALAPEERAALPGLQDKIEPLVAKLNTLNADLVAAINARVSPQGLASAPQAELAQVNQAKTAAERAVHDAFAAIDSKKYPQMYKNEVASSNATPVSDGKLVYWVCGGAQYGTAAYYVACFDLDGKRVWSRLDTSLGTGEHGSHLSPTLAEGKLIYASCRTLIAYDAKTGSELWRNVTAETSKDWWNWPQQPVVVKIGDANIIICHKGLHRLSDGVSVGRSFLDSMYTASTPLVHDGVMFDSARFRNNDLPMSFIAVKLPATLSGKAEVLWDPDGKDVSTPIRGLCFQIASSLYVDGIVYSVDMTGGLTAVEPAAKKLAYRLWLDGYNRYTRFTFGQVASPTLAGKYVYITDDAGFTHVLQPGPQFKELHGNVLENIFPAGLGGNPCKQESFYTSPIFEGKSMYLRGEEYLYCISEK